MRQPALGLGRWFLPGRAYVYSSLSVWNKRSLQKMVEGLIVHCSFMSLVDFPKHTYIHTLHHKYVPMGKTPKWRPMELKRFWTKTWTEFICKTYKESTKLKFKKMKYLFYKEFIEHYQDSVVEAGRIWSPGFVFSAESPAQATEFSSSEVINKTWCFEPI